MRKIYIDNLRCGIVLTVVFYHIFYELNSVGIIRNVAITGIPQLDIVEYITYPWFMVCMFALAGISARYSLEKRGAKTFMKERTRKVLIPSIAGVFVYGWITGFITSRYVDMFGGQADAIPAVVRYLIYGLSGIGPLWFCHVLFIASALLVLLVKLDKDDKLGRLGSRANLPALILLFFAAWESAYLLIAPYISIYRFGIYLFYFFLGYEVFAQEAVQAVLKRYCYLFLAAAVVLGVVYTAQNFGQNFADPEALKLPLVNAFAWFATLALLGCAQVWWNQETAFTRYLRPRSFGFFVLHMPLLVMILYLLDAFGRVSGLALYGLTALCLAVTLPLLYEGVSRIPVFNRLLLGSETIFMKR